ncbi:MAG: protein TevJSym [Proteobacteria bacterium]|nr:protein TevJSym [Pseudomonadota bacterium]
MSGRTTPAPLAFPCDFPIKVFGAGDEGFASLVAEIVRRHAPELEANAIVCRPSKEGRYQAVTVTVRAQSKVQLDAIYRDLSGASDVIMAL